MASPVLLLHGLGGSARRTWRDNGWLDLLADSGRRTVAPDLLGHGEAARPHDPGSYAGLEAHVLADLDAAVGDEPVDAIGFSLGARTLLVLAGTHPERFGRLVLGGVGANLFRHDDTGAFADLLSADAVPEDPVAAYFHQMFRSDGNDPLALAALLRRDAPPLTDELLAAVAGPVLVVLGDRDFAGPPDPLVERLPDARALLVPGTDHFALPKSFAFLDAALGELDALP